jgi:hypothetical protein
MNYSLGNMLSRGGSLNADKLSLDLQFATDKTLTARRGPTPTFTRASGATEVGSDGLIRYAPENLALQSQNFSSATWQKLNGATVGAAVADPFGGNSAYTVNFSSTSFSRVEQGSSGSQTGDVITISVYLRADSNTTIFTRLATETFATFNVTTDWQRFTYTATQQAIGLYPQLNNSGTGAKTIYAYGFQAERHTSARAYIPTTTAAVFNARFDHDPVTLACKGLLIEEARTNLVFPSATLTTQTRTVTAVAHTLSFYGTGTVVLSGAHIATVTGTGAYPTRTTLTFTPSAGSLILTVTGTVTEAQLEAGAFPTSYIPTVASSVVRSADVCSITGSAFTGMYNQPEGTLFLNAVPPFQDQLAYPLMVNTSGASQSNYISRSNEFGAGSKRWRAITTTSSGFEAVISTSGSITTTNVKAAYAYKLNDNAFAVNNVLVGTDTVVTMPSPTSMRIGGNDGANVLNGHIAAVRYFKKRLSNAKLQTITT